MICCPSAQDCCREQLDGVEGGGGKHRSSRGQKQKRMKQKGKACTSWTAASLSTPISAREVDPMVFLPGSMISTIRRSLLACPPKTVPLPSVLISIGCAPLTGGMLSPDVMCPYEHVQSIGHVRVCFNHMPCHTLTLDMLVCMWCIGRQS